MTDNASKPKIDLHMHTTLADGKLTPTELVRLLVERDVSIAAISDHDSTEGLDEAFAAAAANPELRLVPAIEISADHPIATKGDIHMLGYFLDYHQEAFQAKLLSFREDREYRGYHMVQRLAEQGYSGDWERVKAIAADAGIGRPHIAQALVERGYIAQVRDAFNGLLNDDGIAFVARPHISTRDAVDMIRGVGGVAVLAHPVFLPDYRDVITTLPDLGVEGIEVHYAEFDSELRKELGELADRYGLLQCGGSDYHAMGSAGENLPGTAGPPLEVLEELERRAKSRSS